MSSNSSTSRKRSRWTTSDADDDSRSSPSATPMPKKPTRSITPAAGAHPSNPLLENGRNSQGREWNPPFDFEQTIMESHFLVKLQMLHGNLTVRFPWPFLQLLSRQLTRGQADKVKELVNIIDRWFLSYPQTNSDYEQDALKVIQKNWKGMELVSIVLLQPSSWLVQY